MKKIFLDGSSMDEFVAELCSKLIEALNFQYDVNSLPDEELLSRKEAAAMLKINLTTLYNWTESKILHPYYMGRRVYYKKSEILDSLGSNSNLKIV